MQLLIASLSGGYPQEVPWNAERIPCLATVRGTYVLRAVEPVVENQRQTEEILLAAIRAPGATRPLLTERDDA